MVHGEEGHVRPCCPAALKAGTSATMSLAAAHTTMSAADLAYRVVSPDGRVEAILAIDGDGRPTWQILFDGKAVIARSPLGLDLGPDGVLAQGLAVIGISRTRVDRRYTLVAGKTRNSRDRCHQLRLDLEGANGRRRLQLIVRGYDDGVALRYRVRAAVIKAELTAFKFPADYICWGFNMGRFNTGHEGHFLPVRASSIRESDLYDVPLVCRTGSAVFAIAQADLNDYSGMGLSGAAAGAPGVHIKLAPRPDDPTIAVRSRPDGDVLSPWRVVMAADQPGGYPGCLQNQPGTDFLAVVPTSWDETRVITGEIGAFIAIARRSGSDWFIGAMTNEQPRTLTVSSQFLRDARVHGTICADGNTPSTLDISERTFTPHDSIDIHLAGSGGAAIHLRGVS